MGHIAQALMGCSDAIVEADSSDVPRRKLSAAIQAAVAARLRRARRNRDFAHPRPRERAACGREDLETAEACSHPTSVVQELAANLSSRAAEITSWVMMPAASSGWRRLSTSLIEATFS